MAAFTPMQIEALKFLDSTFGADPVGVQAGRMLADRLRTAVPDVDDVTIGRVLLGAGDFVASVIHAAREAPGDSADGEAALSAVAATFACAVITLTEIHWREETP